MSYHFEGKRKIQRTWAGLIRILLAMQGRTDDSAEAVRSMQAEDWGRTESENCLLELLPLPSPGIGQWNYDEWSSLPELRTREDYRQHVADGRTRALRALIQKHAPRSVVFYSVSPDYLSRWSEIANVEFETVEPTQVCIGNQGQQFNARFHSNRLTLFTAIYHPVYKGLTKEYFRRVGQLIHDQTA